MALNFPTSPTDGQVYTDGTTGVSYIYSATYGVWNKTSGAGYYAGNNGNRGDLTNGLGDIFRLHANTLNTSVTIATGRNAIAAGPLALANGVTLTIQDGARAVIV